MKTSFALFLHTYKKYRRKKEKNYKITNIPFKCNFTKDIKKFKQRAFILFLSGKKYVLKINI